jgi:hypothetical protein
MPRNTALIFFAFTAIAAVVCLKAMRTPVQPRPSLPLAPATPAPPPPSNNAAFFERIQLSTAAANNRNEQAFSICERDLNQVLALEFGEIARRGEVAAAEVSSYSSCCTIIYRLAKDKVFGGASAADYVDAEVGRRIRPTLRTCGRELDDTLARFDRDLKASTVILASELAQIQAAHNDTPIDVAVDLHASGDLNKLLRNYGFNVTTIAVTSTLDVWGLLNARLVQGLIAEIAKTAGRMFARPAAAAAAEMTVAVADGPLPIGDVIALVGGAWTAYDIYATRASFEKELKTTLSNAIPDMKRSVHAQVIARMRGSLDSHRQIQDSIRTASANAITH